MLLENFRNFLLQVFHRIGKRFLGGLRGKGFFRDPLRIVHGNIADQTADVPD